MLVLTRTFGSPFGLSASNDTNWSFWCYNRINGKVLAMLIREVRGTVKFLGDLQAKSQHVDSLRSFIICQKIYISMYFLKPVTKSPSDSTLLCLIKTHLKNGNTLMVLFSVKQNNKERINEITDNNALLNII